MTKDMTKGRPMQLIIAFAIPLIMGFLFQQFYNLVDTLIVGRYLGVEALAAVGSTSSISFMVIGFCTGTCNGFSIPVAQKFGAKDYSSMRKTVANALWLGIIFAAVITFQTTFFCQRILILMRIPENIIASSRAYIFIIFLGIPALFLYNGLSGIIRALGDSKTPLMFLIISSILNIFLDLIFIICFKLGVSGAALATVLSQCVSGILCLIYMIRKFEILHIQKEEWKVTPSLLALLCNMGLPMGLQYSITAIGSATLQSAVNSLGSNAVASMAAAVKIHGFMGCPFDALGSSMATYSGQNIGAKKLTRIKEGLRDSLIIGGVYSVAAFLVAFFAGKALIGLFITGEDIAGIIADAHFFLIMNTSFYFTLAIVNIVRFIIQGMGFPKISILSGVLEMIARTFTGFALVPVLGFKGACLGSPIAWVLADSFLFYTFYRVYQIKKKEFSL